MSAGDRRSQLLDVAQDLFSGRPFDDVSMEVIATHAGVTRALVYHYFPTKAELFAAVWQRVHESLRTTADFRSVTTVREVLVGTLTAYLDFYAEHLPLVLIANRSPIAATHAVRDPIDDNFRVLCGAVLDAARATGHQRELAQAAFTGWVAFIRETTLVTLVDGAITQSENLAMCTHVLDATVGVHVDLTVAPSGGDEPPGLSSAP